MKLKKVAFKVRYVPGQYKIQQTFDKSILENGETLASVPYRYKTQ